MSRITDLMTRVEDKAAYTLFGIKRKKKEELKEHPVRQRYILLRGKSTVTFDGRPRSDERRRR